MIRKSISTLFSFIASSYLIIRRGTARTAGPSEPRSMAEPGPEERTPLDLLDEDFRPPEGYQPKYERTLTMTAEEQTETDEVQELLLALELLGHIDA